MVHYDTVTDEVCV